MPAWSSTIQGWLGTIVHPGVSACVLVRDANGEKVFKLVLWNRGIADAVRRVVVVK